MSILDLGPSPKEKSVGKQSKRIFLGFGLLMAVIGIGSTFASTISINAGQEIEFGQGVQRSVFCGDEESITITPISEFVNGGDDEELGTFGFTGITISDIPENCSDRNFIIKVYGDEAGSLPLTIASAGSESIDRVNVWWASGCPEEDVDCRLNADGFPTTTGGAAVLSKNIDAYASTTLARVLVYNPASFTVEFSNGVLSSDDVTKIVIETQNDTFGYQCVLDETCSLSPM
jgi:hypothetical protein